MTQPITQAKDTAIALKCLVEAKDLQSKASYSFKDVEQLLLKASDHNISAYVELAKLYEKHDVFDEALKWYMRKYNNSMLENEDIVKVASWYEQGIGTEVDNNMAVKLYTGIAFVDDEALKGAIRLYKNNNIDYVRSLAPGLMTLEKWEDEARKRGVIKESRTDEKKLRQIRNDIRESFKKDDEIIKNLGKGDFKFRYFILMLFMVLISVIIGSGVSDYLVRLHEVNDGHWFAAVVVMLLSGGVCSFIPILVYSFAKDVVSGGSIMIGAIGGLLVPVFTGFEHMGSGIGAMFVLSAFISLSEYEINRKE